MEACGPESAPEKEDLMDRFLELGGWAMAAKSVKDDTEGWMPFHVHSLDTADILSILKERWTAASFYKSLGLSDDAEAVRLVRFAGLVHDIGKLTACFQYRRLAGIEGHRERLEEAGFNTDIRLSNMDKTPHAIAGKAILRFLGVPASIADVTGAHHGIPSKDVRIFMSTYKKNMYGNQKEKWEALWRAWLDFALRESGYRSVSDIPVLDQAGQVLLTGLLITGDWLSSNPYFFPLSHYDSPCRAMAAFKKMDFPDRWQSGFTSSDFAEYFGFHPNPIQQAVMDRAEAMEAPGLMILEASMGIGKTEAALAAAGIMARKFGCSGVFFGLPSQATSNGLFPRLASWAGHLDKRHSIQLLHGSARLNRDLGAIRDGDDGAGEKLFVNDWFENKTGLLSDFAAGTVDQLLMGALLKKHFMLRHLGISGKVVIIDECHAYDAYMGQYLQSILSWLGRYRTPVIILSATLPVSKRQALIRAYLGTGEDADIGAGSKAYPLLTWTQGGCAAQEDMVSGKPRKKVRLKALYEKDLAGYLKRKVPPGAVAGLIVNTVAKAQDLFAELKKTLPGWRIILYHSAFVRRDRIEKEDLVMDAAGKERDACCGPVLVIGTQVLEQSLDIDFDLLISQLCPIDLLLQRIGRLHRHNRERLLKEPVCAILRPRWAPYDKGSEVVYGKWLLDQTDRVIRGHGDIITIDDDIPVLVDRVYSPDPEYEKDQVYEDYHKEQNSARSSAGFLLGKPERPGPMSLIQLLNNEHFSMTSHASVRKGCSIEAAVAVERKDGIHLLPWIEEGRAAALQDLFDLQTVRLSEKKAAIMEDDIVMIDDRPCLILDEGLQAGGCVYDRDTGLSART